MTAEGHKVASLHGAKDGAERDEIIDRFREGLEKVLITTNVIARGIDIMQVNVVVNYDLPMMSDKGEGGSYDPRFETPDIETYLHRIGKSSYCFGDHRLTKCIFRSYWALWTEGCFDQLCAQQKDLGRHAYD